MFDNNLYSTREHDYSQFIFDSYNPDLARLDNLPVEQQAHWFFWTEDIDDDMIQKDMFESTNNFVYRVFQMSEWLDWLFENTRQADLLAKSNMQLK
ncbi:hypothetical protein [Weissella paramesenteroides]|uniref:hypothetical protein n=1 Tax=Weissella paramesenteroides TaxID=1249 RepID=UPI00388FC8C9